MKGEIQADHMPVNKYELSVIGLADLTPTKVSGVEEEVTAVDLPDRTKASGGVKPPSEVVITIPLHHVVQMTAMEVWYKEGQDPVSPTYKKAATLVHKSISDSVLWSYTWVGVWVMKRKLPDLEKINDGEIAEAEWTLSIDDQLPI